MTISKVKEIKAKFNNDSSYNASLLKGLCSGTECYIVSCGPSLKQINHDLLRYLMRDKLVICVKQAHRILSSECDFHLLNFIHLEEYNYDGDPVKIELTRFGKQLTESDIYMPINVKDAGHYLRSVSAQRNFDDYLFDRTLQRPFGPGLVFELAFYLAVHLGVSGITTIGFDAAFPNTHYYGDNADEPTEARLSLLKREMSFVNAGLPHFDRWLKSKGIDLKIISDLSKAPKSIKRITVDDIPKPNIME